MVRPKDRLHAAASESPVDSDAMWPWTQTLATARPGMSYRVARMPFSLARTRCAELGCTEGEVVTCRENGAGMLVLERPDGRQVILERELAWFIRAELLPARSAPR